MKDNFPLSPDKKLTVFFRLEPGCLGPKGSEHIEQFCQLAQKEFETLYSDIVQWEIVPRNDKSLPEIQYKINNKNLSREQASTFLSIFDKNLGGLEEKMNQTLADQIDQYMGH